MYRFCRLHRVIYIAIELKYSPDSRIFGGKFEINYFGILCTTRRLRRAP